VDAISDKSEDRAKPKSRDKTVKLNPLNPNSKIQTLNLISGYKRTSTFSIKDPQQLSKKKPLTPIVETPAANCSHLPISQLLRNLVALTIYSQASQTSKHQQPLFSDTSAY
jgi:hypothetical protein